MTKPMTIHPIPTRRTQGFTLIEMLVVAALIAIFAGLAVFNIVEQLQREKEKAAIAEARSIATAMSFAHNDLSYYPKLCFLRFGIDELTEIVNNYSLPNGALDWFDRSGPTMMSSAKVNWSDSKYMSGSMPDKYVQMTVNFRNGGSQAFNWPADPWKQPYVAYIIKMDYPGGATSGPKVPQWANETLGDRANYFAGIVSYGRNKVPGYAWDDTRAPSGDSKAYRLFTEDSDGNPLHFVTSGASAIYLNPADPAAYPPSSPPSSALGWFVAKAPNPIATSSPWTGNPPAIRDAGSDDKFFEF